MKIMLSTLALLILSGCCSLVLAADGFGARFGNTAPYALQNDINQAQSDVEGIGLEDLNDINPAAGAADFQEYQEIKRPGMNFDEQSEDELFYAQELEALGETIEDAVESVNEPGEANNIQSSE